MKSLKYIFGGLFAIFLLIYIVFLFVLPNVLDLNKYKGMIAGEVQKVAGLKLDISDLKLYTTPDLRAGVRASGVTLSYADSGMEFLIAKSADADIKLIPLIFKTVEIGRITADSAQLQLKLLADGKTDLEDYIMPVLAKNPPAKEMPIKISAKIPKIEVKNYDITLTQKSNVLEIKGERFAILGGELGKNLKVAAIGSIFANKDEVVKYDIFADSFIPASQEESVQAAPGNKISLDVLSKIVKYKFKSDLTAHLKISEKDGNIGAKGTIDAKNIGFLLGNKQIENNSVNMSFDDNKIALKTDFSIAANEKVKMSAKISTGKNTDIDLLLATDKLSLSNVQTVAATLADILNIKSDINDFNIQGILKSDIELKTNLKKINSKGRLLIENGKISHKSIPLNISSINTEIDFNGNALKFVNAKALFNDSLFSLSGEVDSNANSNLSIKCDKLPIGALYQAFAPTEYKNAYAINSGTANFTSEIKGKLDKAAIKAGVGVNDLKLYDKVNKIGVSPKSIKAELTCKDNRANGTANVINTKISMPGLPFNLNLRNLALSFDTADIKILSSDLYVDSTLVKIEGVVKNYAANMKFDVWANGKLNTADIKKLIPKEAKSFVSTSGAVPFTASISGDDKNISILAQALADGANNISFLNLHNLAGKQSLLNVAVKSDFKNVTLEDISLNGLDKTVSLNGIVNLSSAKSFTVGAIKGNVTDAFGKMPVLNNIKVSLPSALSASIPNMKNSNVELKGAMSLNGQVNKPNLQGNILVSKLAAPDFFVNASNLDVELKNDLIIVKCPYLALKSSKFNFAAKISSDFSKLVVIKDLSLDSDYMNFDELMGILGSLPQNGMSQNTSVPAKVLQGKGIIKVFKTGDLTAENAASDFTLINDVLKLPNITCDAYQGKISGSVVHNIAHAATDMQFDGKGLNASKSVGAMSGIKDPFSGTLDFSTSLSMYGATFEQQMKSLRGSLGFSVLNGYMGGLGKFERFINAQNILAQNVLLTNMNSVVNTVSLKNTGKFDNLKGNMTFNNGYAYLSPVTMSGPTMSMYISGKYNILNNYADIEVLGRVSRDVTALLGPLGDMSLDKIISNIPKIGATVSKVLTTYNDTTAPENLAKIPALTLPGEYKNFIVVINGDAQSPKAIKSFKWLSPPQEMDKAQANILDIFKKPDTSGIKPVIPQVIQTFIPAKPADSQSGTTNTAAPQKTVPPVMNKVKPFLDLMEALPDNFKKN